MYQTKAGFKRDCTSYVEKLQQLQTHVASSFPDLFPSFAPDCIAVLNHLLTEAKRPRLLQMILICKSMCSLITQYSDRTRHNQYSLFFRCKDTIMFFVFCLTFFKFKPTRSYYNCHQNQHLLYPRAVGYIIMTHS